MIGASTRTHNRWPFLGNYLPHVGNSPSQFTATLSTESETVVVELGVKVGIRDAGLVVALARFSIAWEDQHACPENPHRAPRERLGPQARGPEQLRVDLSDAERG